MRADFESRLSIQSGSLVRRSMANVLAIVWSGAAHMVYGSIDWLSDQLFAETAEREFLIPMGENINVIVTAAVAANGILDATGTDPNTIPNGTIYVRDDGATYTTTALVTMSGGVASPPVTADVAGQAGNMATGDILTLQSPLTGIDAIATVDADGITGGTDVEDTEDLRARIKQRRRETPRGGTDADYEAWALAVAGVTRAWIYRHEDGLGTVKVRFVRDDDVPIIPDGGEVTTVQTALDAERPTTAEVTAAAPVDDPVAFTIAITPDTSALRTAVETELDDLFFRDAAPGDGAGFGEVLLSQMQVAVGNTTGITDYTISVPAADYTPALGDLPTVGTITWV